VPTPLKPRPPADEQMGLTMLLAGTVAALALIVLYLLVVDYLL
jgi:hypothetical protein